MYLENSGLLKDIYRVVDAIEKISDVLSLESVIVNDLKEIIQYDRLAYVLSEKKDLKVVRKLNLDYPEYAFGIFVDDENRIKEEAFSRWHTAHRFGSLYAASYGLQDSEGKYVSFFLGFNPKIKEDVESNKILELILPWLHSSFVKLHRSAFIHSANIKSLSPREKEILSWVSRGKTNSEIGMILDISAYTVKNHVSNILEKLNVANRAEALDKAMMYLM